MLKKQKLNYHPTFYSHFSKKWSHFLKKVFSTEEKFISQKKRLSQDEEKVFSEKKLFYLFENAHLKKRKDDNLDVVVARYDTYMKATKPVLDFYSKNSNFSEIDGAAEIDQITGKINDILMV